MSKAEANFGYYSKYVLSYRKYWVLYKRKICISIEIYKSRVAERLRCQNEYSVSEN